MLRTYTAYIINRLNGRTRDVMIRAVNSERVRKVLEESYIKSNEVIVCIYPSLGDFK